MCGKCDAEWSFQEVRKMALLTPEEVKEFEEKKLRNAAKRSLSIREVSFYMTSLTKIQLRTQIQV